MKYLPFLLLFCAASFLSSCNSKDSKKKEGEAKLQHQVQKNQVKTLVIHHQDFQKQLRSNGKLVAQNKSELFFSTAGILKNLQVKNGMRVQKGRLLAQLEDFDISNQYLSAKQAMAKARLSLDDLLIGQGYALADSTSIPAQIFSIAKLKSGYQEAKLSLKKAKYNLDACSLYAPFSGVVANLNGKQYQKVDISKAFCMLVDQSQFEVEFTILESELSEVKVGQEVKITPFALDQNFKGKISEINPLVDENALVKVKAKVKNSSGELLEGMNVKVIVENQLKNQLVIPKSALLLRQNKQVVFTHKGGIAYWNYVKTENENSEAYTIVEGLKDGDEVIVEGNLNLAHEAKVAIVE
jgi:RND family efflux transporter MFP subunit